MQKDQRFYHSSVLRHRGCTIISNVRWIWLRTFWDCFFAAGLPDFYGVSLLQKQQSDGIGMGGSTVFGAGAICKGCYGVGDGDRL